MEQDARQEDNRRHLPAQSSRVALQQAGVAEARAGVAFHRAVVAVLRQPHTSTIVLTQSTRNSP